MSISGEILEFLKRQRTEIRIQRLLDIKGYSNPQADEFGINQWTSRLTFRQTGSDGEKPDEKNEWPEHFVSFLAIPEVSNEELTDVDSGKLHDWVSDYQWHQPPGIDLPFPYSKFQACSEGIILPRWNKADERECLESFLLVQRDGAVEFGLEQEAYFIHRNAAFFLYISIVGRFWQFLMFVNHFLGKAFPENSGEILVLINLRGTKGAFLSDLADGWVDPRFEAFSSYRPKCPDKHLQIRKKIASNLLDTEIEDIVHWFATRIDNAWGQFEPRCYVHKNKDASQPFSRRKSR